MRMIEIGTLRESRGMAEDIKSSAVFLLRQLVRLIVLRGAFFAERESSGEICCKCLVFLGLNLRVYYAFCALLHRMGISGCEVVVETAMGEG
jgi:hypothetical protein